MKLTHVCPNCLSEHEMECTPEPNQLCPECSNNLRLVVVYELYDLSGKVMETMCKNKALKWKDWGDKNRFHNKKRQYIRTRKILVRKEPL